MGGYKADKVTVFTKYQWSFMDGGIYHRLADMLWCQFRSTLKYFH